jgi:hypothetical protein
MNMITAYFVVVGAVVAYLSLNKKALKYFADMTYLTHSKYPEHGYEVRFLTNYSYYPINHIHHHITDEAKYNDFLKSINERALAKAN